MNVRVSETHARLHVCVCVMRLSLPGYVCVNEMVASVPVCVPMCACVRPCVRGFVPVGLCAHVCARVCVCARVHVCVSYVRPSGPGLQPWPLRSEGGGGSSRRRQSQRCTACTRTR